MDGTAPPQTVGPRWLKSRKSLSTGACVELAIFNGMILMRDSKHPQTPPLCYTPEEMDAFLEGVKNGEFDHLVYGGLDTHDDLVKSELTRSSAGRSASPAMST